MRTITLSQWQPAMMPRPAMSQTPLPMAPVTQRPAFIDSPLVQFLTDITASVGSGMLGYAFGKENSRWSTVFWVISGITGFKALFDGVRLNR